MKRMRRIRAITVPLFVLAAACALALQNLQLDSVANFSFIWDVLLGSAVGVGLALLPAMSGFPGRQNGLVPMFWVCGFISLLMIFYQYMSAITGMHIQGLAFLAVDNPRVRIVESVLLGYCSMTAGRGKI